MWWNQVKPPIYRMVSIPRSFFTATLQGFNRWVWIALTQPVGTEASTSQPTAHLKNRTQEKIWWCEGRELGVLSFKQITKGRAFTSYKWGCNTYKYRVTTPVISRPFISGLGPILFGQIVPIHGDQVIQVVWVLAGVHLCCKHLRSSRILRVLLGKKNTLRFRRWKGNLNKYTYKQHNTRGYIMLYFDCHHCIS